VWGCIDERRVEPTAPQLPRDYPRLPGCVMFLVF
jgi:hypothetical protein